MKTTHITQLLKTILKTTRSLGAALLLTAGAHAFADTNWYITTDHTGAQTQIDTNHLSSWIFGVPTNMAGIEIWGGDFIMKDGPRTDESLTFSIYFGALTPADLFAGTNTPFATAVLSNAEFKLQNSTDQQYNPVILSFTDIYGSNAPVLLNPSITYTAALTSAAMDVASHQYFIKGGNLEFVPEPSTYALMGLGVVALILMHLHHRKARRSDRGKEGGTA